MPQGPDGVRQGLSRRSLVAGALVGAVAPFLAWRGIFADSGQISAPPPQLPPGSVNVFDFLDPRQLSDVRAGRGAIDVTRACQRALRAGRQVYFPAGVYLVDAAPTACLRAGSNQTITFAEGAVLKARGNALDQYYVLLIEDVRNVTVEGGTIVGERSVHQGSSGEHGMGIGVFGSAGVTLRGITVRDCWGDGIYIGGRGFEGRSSNVRIEQCLCDGNRRQGLTISAVEGCAVIGGRFIRTRGTLPASGIDIEPNHGVSNGISRPKGAATNIVITGAECSDNQGHGLTLSQVHTRNVRVVELTAHRNGMSGISAGYPGSDITIESPDCRDNGDNGIEIFGDKAYITRQIHIASPTCGANRRNGIRVGFNVDGFSISGGTVSGNGEHGIVCDGTGGTVCDNGVIEKVRVEANSQWGDASFDNIFIGPRCRRIMVQANTVAEGSGARKPRYGINVATDGAVTVVSNDLRGMRAARRARGLTQPKVGAWNNTGAS